MQGEANAWSATSAPGDAYDLLGMRRGDDGSLQADPGQAGTVPVVLPETASEAACCAGAGYDAGLEADFPPTIKGSQAGGDVSFIRSAAAN